MHSRDFNFSDEYTYYLVEKSSLSVTGEQSQIPIGFPTD
nr:MAG TPA: hypothetical protein [Caudoviricetes sp.]